MNKKLPCCGRSWSSYNNIGSTIAKSIKENPVIKDPRKVIYIGTKNIKIKGQSTGFSYYVSPVQRYIEVHKDDVEKILSNSEFILKP